VDTVLGKKYYVFFLIWNFNRKIIKYGITTNPSREFIRQQIIVFSDTLPEPVYIIHDRLPEKACIWVSDSGLSLHAVISF
jgi:hypothetical protein